MSHGTAAIGGVGAAFAMATSDYGGDVSVVVLQRGGDGGSATNNATWFYGGFANGAFGRDSTLTNAVSGYSHGGSLTLIQNAFGGSGGSGADTYSLSPTSFGIAGGGGDANSTIDTSSHGETSISASTSATAGNAGEVFGTQIAPDGGFATANTIVTASGSTELNLSAEAHGGIGGGVALTQSDSENFPDPPLYTSGGTSGQGGLAIAIARGTTVSGNVTASASATGGSGGGSDDIAEGGGDATAQAYATSISGAVMAKATAKGGAAGVGSFTSYPGAASVFAEANSGGIVAIVTDGNTAGGSVSVTARAVSNLSSGSMTGGTVTINGVTVDAPGSGPLPSMAALDAPLTTATLTQSDGTITASNRVTINASGTYNMSGGTLDTPLLEIQGGGTFNYSGGTADSSVSNSGTFSVSTGSLDVFGSPPPGGASFSNSSTGVFQKITNSGTSHLYLPSTWNSGTINVATGTISLEGATTISTGSTLTKIGTGTLVLNGTQSHGAGTFNAFTGTTVFNTNVGTSLYIKGTGTTNLVFNGVQNIGMINNSAGYTSTHFNPGSTGSISIGTYSGGLNVEVASGSVTINHSNAGNINKFGAGTLIDNSPIGDGYVGDGVLRLTSPASADSGYFSIDTTASVYDAADRFIDELNDNGHYIIEQDTAHTLGTRGLITNLFDDFTVGDIDIKNNFVIFTGENPFDEVESFVGDGKVFSSMPEGHLVTENLYPGLGDAPHPGDVGLDSEYWSDLLDQAEENWDWGGVVYWAPDSSPSAIALGAAVPEPASFGLIMLSVIGVTCRRRRSK
jgi:hypothetical protein